VTAVTRRELAGSSVAFLPRREAAPSPVPHIADGVDPRAIEEAFRVLLTLCKSKLHRATVTEAALDYEGSISIDGELMQAAEILPFERVQVVDVANGARLETYAMEEAAGSGIVRMNGAAARLVQVGDPVIIISYVLLTPQEAREHHPIIVVLGPDNKIKEQRRD